MQIIVKMEVPDDMADPEDDTGLTEEDFDELNDILIEFGATDIDVRKAN